MDDADISSTATTTTPPSGQVKPKLAEAVALPLGVVNMMNVVAMKATTIATKGDRKEQLSIGHEEEEDDRVEGEDDEDVDMDSPRYKKPRREVEQKKKEHEINEHMDTHSEEEKQEPLESLLFNTLPPEVHSFLFFSSSSTLVAEVGTAGCARLPLLAGQGSGSGLPDLLPLVLTCPRGPDLALPLQRTFFFFLFVFSIMLPSPIFCRQM
jgi:hypothetical protein